MVIIFIANTLNFDTLQREVRGVKSQVTPPVFTKMTFTIFTSVSSNQVCNCNALALTFYGVHLLTQSKHKLI